MTLLRTKSPDQVRGDEQLETYFAPAGRSSALELAHKHSIVEQEAIFSLLEESVDGYLMILSPEREVLAANEELLELLEVDNCATLIGLRPGEALGCIRADEGPDGCGTGIACRSCGATGAILDSKTNGVPAVRECLLTLRDGKHTSSCEFRVRATPTRIGGVDFTVVVFTDVSGDKRRETLEHTFFHDLLNTIGGLMGWSKVLQRCKDKDPKEIAARILDLSKQLVSEVEDHRKLLQAEQGSLLLCEEPATVTAVLGLLEQTFGMHPVAQGRHLIVAEPYASEQITTDVSLLLRVLTNMVKNALEASAEGDMIRVWFERRAGAAVFCVHNPGCIPEDAALRIFQRSFSTKAKEGRGIGTYSMKLFGEKYLGGKVEFESSEETGTTFSIRLPGDGKRRAASFTPEPSYDLQCTGR